MTYVTLQELQDYVDNYVVDSDTYDMSIPTVRQKTLNLATRAIDRLNFEGCPSDPNQTNQFPRGGDVTVPTAIKDATCELALALLCTTLDNEADKLSIQHDQFLAVKTSRDTNAVSENVINGIISYEAWLLLKPYLRPFSPEIIRA